MLNLSIFFNMGSLILGIAAWLIPVVALIRAPKRSVLPTFIFASFTACTISLLLQLFEIQNRVNWNDFPAIEDTIGTLVWVALILIAVTCVLNLFALRKRTSAGE